MAEWRERGYVPDSDDEEDEKQDLLSRDDTLTDTKIERPPERKDIGSDYKQSSPHSDIQVQPASLTENHNPAVLAATQSHDLKHAGDDPAGFSHQADDLQDGHLANEENWLRNLALPDQDSATVDQNLVEENGSSVSEQLQNELRSGLDIIEEVLSGSPATSKRHSDKESCFSSPLSSIKSFRAENHSGYHTAEAVSDSPSVLANRPLEQPSTQPIDNELSHGTSFVSGEQVKRRNLRQRNPIQLHPYALEGARYQQELLARGLKPVYWADAPRQRNPEASETQDGDSGESKATKNTEDTSSQQDSSGALQPIINNAVRKRSRKQSSNAPLSDGELPDLDAILEGRPGSLPRVRKQLQRVYKAPRVDRSLDDDNDLRVYDLPSDAAGFTLRGTQGDDVFRVPPSPPHSHSIHSSQTNQAVSGPPKRNFPASRVTPQALPTPTTSSTAQQPTVLPFQFDGDSDSSKNAVDDLSRSSSPRSFGQVDKQILQLQRKTKGVLPASFFRFQGQSDNARKNQVRQRSLSSEPDVDVQGVAHRLSRPRNTRNSPSREFNNTILVSDDSPSDEASLTEGSGHREAPSSPSRRYDMMDMLGSDIEEDDSIDMMVQPQKRKRKLTNSTKKRQRRISEFGYAMNDHPRSGLPRRRTLKTRKGLSSKEGSRRRQNRKTSKSKLPVLGPLDAPGYTSLPRMEQPRFLRVAARRARSHKAGSRQSPSRKYIRLATNADTYDANSELTNWRKGLLRQNVGASSIAAHQQTGHRPHQGSDQATGPEIQNTILSESARINEASQPITHDGSQIEHHSPNREIENVIREIVRGQKSHVNPSSNNLTNPIQSSSHDNTLGRLRHPAPVHTQYRNRSGRGLLLSSTTGFAKPREAQFESPVLRKPRDRIRSAFQGSLISSGVKGIPDPVIEAPDHRKSPQSPECSTPDALAKDKSRQALPRTLRKRPPMRANINSVISVWQLDPAENVPSLDNNVLDPLSGVVLAGLGSPEFPITYDFDVVPFKAGTHLQGTSFVGQGYLSQLIRNLIHQPRSLIRSTKDVHAVIRPSAARPPYCWDPCNNQVSTQMTAWFKELGNCLDLQHAQNGRLPSGSWQNILAAARSLIACISCHLSFHDRQTLMAFAENGVVMSKELALHVQRLIESEAPSITPDLHRFSYFALVLIFEIACIAAIASLPRELQKTVHESFKTLALAVLKPLFQENCLAMTVHLLIAGSNYSRTRTEYPEIEALVMIYHLSKQTVLQINIWDLITDALLTSVGTRPENLVTFQDYDRWWKGIFLSLPLLELDASGLPQRRSGPSGWDLVQRIVIRFMSLYIPRRHNSGYSTKLYGRVLVQRCFDLVHVWGWQGGHSAIGALFDAYSNDGLHELFGETPEHPFCIPVNLAPGTRMHVARADSGFHAFLGLVAQTILDAQRADADRKLAKRVLRSLSARLVPTPGEPYSREENPGHRDLIALRNRFDLTSVMYCVMSTELKPSLRLFQSLVDFRLAHRGACKIALRCWSQLVQHTVNDEDSISAAEQKPLDDRDHNALLLLREWHDQMVMDLLDAYKSRNLKVLPRDGFPPLVKVGPLDKPFDVRKPIAETLKEALKASEQSLGLCLTARQATDLFSQKAIGEVLNLFDAEDPAPNLLVSAALQVVRAYAHKCRPQISQNTPADEDSQEYGSWDHFDAMVVDDQDLSFPNRDQHVYLLDEIHPMLRRFLSNVFGSDTVPDHAVLKITAECWFEIADALVCAKARSWDDMVSQYSTDSWESLRQTQQTQQYKIYFLAKVVDSNYCFYEANRLRILELWISSLCQPEGLLCWEHLLTSILLFHDPENELLFNSPFVVRSDSGDRLEIPMFELRERRISMIYVVLRNMHRLLALPLMSFDRSLPYSKADFSTILRSMELTMKNYYQDLGPDSQAQNEYRFFINLVTQQMQLYVVDFHKIDTFLTDPAICSAEANAVTTALKRYSLNIQATGVTKSMVLFLYNASEKAAVQDSQDQFILQLENAFLDLSREAIERTENHDSDAALLALFLQDVFTAYVNHAFSGPGHIVARPLLRVLTYVYQNLRCRSDLWNSSSLQRLALATEAVLSSAIKAFKSCEPDIFLTSNQRLDNFNELVTFVHAAALRMYEAAQAFPNSVDPSITIEALLLLKDHILAVESLPHADAEFLDLEPDEDMIAELTVEPSAMIIYAEKELQNALDRTWRPSRQGCWEIIGRDTRKVVKASRRTTLGASEEDEMAHCRQNARYAVQEFVEGLARLDWWE